ncbi:hypothetical protein M0812_00507 [Anaeramoeba flamelloides]|uniref:Uncharacterized protein n=1 Tax=Anaeramoeba flamelloides TaxID=1746091 RepID=A0AAV8A1D4_9EUKA|nr:hypothetical protein M0812_00507 [Anaeramoeba flamelloides]
MNKSTKHKGGCSCCNIRIRIQSVELLEDFSNIPNELQSRFEEPCVVTCKMGGYFVENKNLIKKTKLGEWTIFECLDCNSPPFACHSENRNLYLVDLINIKQTNTNKIIEEPYYFDQQTTKNLDEMEQIYTEKNIDRTRTKKKRRRRRRKHKRKSKKKNDYQNKIKIKSAKQIGFNNMLHPFLKNTKTTEIPQEFYNNETQEFNNYSFMTDPFFQFRKEEEENKNKNKNKNKKKKKKNKNDRQEIQKFSEIFRKVSEYEQNHSTLFDEGNQFYSDDQQENWEIFQQESKSIPIPISNSLSTDLQSDSSVDNTENPNNSLFIQPHKFLETSQQPTERGIEKAFNVPLKRVPTWRIQSNCLNVFGNLTFEN